VEPYLQLIVIGVIWGLLYGLIASGLNIIYGVMGILNIAHGTFLMIGAYLAFWLFELWGISPLWSLFIAMLSLFGIGIAVHGSVVQPIIARDSAKEAIEKSTLIAFFGILILLDNVALVLFSADYRSVRYLNQPINFLGIYLSVNKLIVFGVSLILNVALIMWMSKSWTGRAIRAIIQDRETSTLLGINHRFLGYLTFGIGSALCGAAGVLISMLFVITPSMGFPFLIKAFTVMIIGGFGSATGSFVAGIVLGIAESLGSFIIGESYKEAIDYIILLPFIFLVSKGYILKERAI
jgi:branched-chain amino acid transport system permease protein